MAAAPMPEPAVTEPEAPEPELHEPGPLLGGYRPSSLRLIDEAVAAAEAIEPSLFENEHDDLSKLDEARERTEAHANGTAVPTPIEDDDDEDDDEASDTDEPDELQLEERREDSGVRMIGSLGRDRAEASGELARPLEPPPRTITQRELVTIMPRTNCAKNRNRSNRPF